MHAQHFPELREMALGNAGSIDTREALTLHLGKLDDERLRQLAGRCVCAA